MEGIPFWTAADVKNHLPQRTKDSHKGTYGTALLIAGSSGMPGAAALAAKAAMRSGVGKLVVATAKDSVLPIASHVPEATFDTNLMARVNDPDIQWNSYRAIAIGPGMKPDSATEIAVGRLLELNIPLVLDAGALSRRDYSKVVAPVILTPHHGEFSRLTGVTVDQHEGNRTKFAAEWSQKLNITLVLKGKNTVIAFSDGRTYVNPTGNSSLAKGGTGDTLTGMLLGMLCCHDNWQHAVLNAVLLHGACADEWLKTRSAHTLLAHELADLLPFVLKSYES